MSFAFGTLFTRFHAPRMLPDLLTAIDLLHPDLLIHESGEFSTPLAGTLRGVPWAHHSYGIIRPSQIQRLATEAMLPLWREFGQPVPANAGVFSNAYIDVCPPSLQLEQELPPTRVPMRAATGPAGPETLPRISSRPLVLVTFGTVFHRAPGRVADIARAVARLPVDVLWTSGPGVPPGSLAPQPANVQVVEYVPLAQILPLCAAVVSHGGSGTMLAALAHGVPLVVLPQGADQFMNAGQVSVSGAGLTADTRAGPGVDD
ncbi:MAG: glycosyltransferase family 1 protein, partial [Propionibacteriaceae bacterium]|nr:glycosyltransferase family 1 protein [Propionibacteriaceae bacterium]